MSRIKLQANPQQSSDLYRVLRNTYSMHQSIWQIFSDNANRQRDFIYRLDSERGLPLIYSVSARRPLDCNFWSFDVKEYSPKIKDGTKLAFMLRVNPIVTKRDELKRQHRHDVVMEAKKQLKKNGEVEKTSILAQSVCSKWLLSRAEKYGFSVCSDGILVDGYQRHRFFKNRQSRPITLSTVELSGILSVTDSEQFVRSLYEGIGPAKGFGCGLLMVRRV